MTALRWTNDVLAFALELAALAALLVWGFAVGPNLLWRIAIGVGAAAVLIAVWGYWLAPRARHPLTRPGVFAAKLMIFLIAAAALWAAGHAWPGATLGVLAVINLGLWWSIGSAAEPDRQPRG